MRIEKYLDDLRDTLGVKTDKEVIAKLGWSTGTVSNWRKGRAFMTNQTAGQVAELLGVPVIQIIAAVEADREEVTGQKSFWTAFFQRTVSHAAPAALFVALAASVTNFVTPSPAEAAPLSHSEGRPLCVMLNRRRLWARLQQALHAVQARTEPAPA